MFAYIYIYIYINTLHTHNILWTVQDNLEQLYLVLYSEFYAGEPTIILPNTNNDHCKI